MANTLQFSLSRLVLLAVCLVFCAPLRAATNPSPVVLTDKGSTVVLSNGIVSVTIQKGDGKVTSFLSTAFGSTNILEPSYGMSLSLTHIGSGTDDYWTAVSDNGGATYSVVMNTPQMVDVMIRNPKATGNGVKYPNGLWDWAIHHVLRAGDSGFYTYHVWRHNASQPQAYFGGDGWGGRGNGSLFSARDGYMAWDFDGTGKIGPSFGGNPPGTTNVNTETQKLPLTSYYTQPTGQTDAYGRPLFTYPTGLTSDWFPTWTKYDWNSYLGSSTSARSAYGMANDQVGLWRLCASNEYQNGGPTKLKGAVSGDYMYMDGVEEHGIGSGTDNPGAAAGQVMTKVVGPFFTYVNTGTNHLALWQDAQNRAAQEVAAWPYAWVNESETDYPRQRGVVTGTITAATGQPTANAVVIMSPPPTAGWTGPDLAWTGQGAWMWEGALNYQYWTTADANGRFTLPKVSPGSYTLYSYTPGIFGEFKLTNVTVAANQTTDLGIVTWDPPRRQQQIWQIGNPDHSSQEFRHGSDFKQFGLWWRYMEEQGTPDLNYTIGQSTPGQNWYYAQTLVAVAGGTYFAPRWNINFTLPAALPDPVVLTVDLAGGYGTYFYTYVNGTNVTPTPANYYAGFSGKYSGWPTTSGADIYRDVVQVGRWQHYELTLPSSAFHAGANTLAITIRQPGFSGTWTGATRPEMPAGGLMYDALKLEAGPQVYAVVGNAALQGWAGTGAMPPLTCTLTPTGATGGSIITQTVTPAADGSFALTSVPAGTYTLGVQGSKWLRKNQAVSVNTTVGSVSVLGVPLLGGDANGDNQVNGTDYLILRKAYGTSRGDANYDDRADFNGDGQVNGADYLILRQNYGKNGD